MEKRKDCVKIYLNGLGYSVNGDALGIIKICDDWYSNRIVEDFHGRMNLDKKEIGSSRMNFAKRCCADDANLCEIISVVPEKNAGAQEFIDKFLANNRFEVRYREQLEKTSATGTVGAYVYLKDAKYLRNPATQKECVKGGSICINYVDADCIIPLTVENGLVTECAFCATNMVKGKEKTTLVMFTLESGRYKAATIIFDERGKKVDAESSGIQLGDIKPFAIMTNAEVNNLDNMYGYGLPKIYNAIPLFRALDLCYTLLKTDENGQAELTPYNQEIRIEEITRSSELILSLLSMQFGYGSRKYTFEDGRLITAVEYIGTRQDAMQELRKQRKQAAGYIEDIIRAAMWFSNQFHGTAFDMQEALSIEFDDSYVEDKQTRLKDMRADALAFGEAPMLKVWYLMEKYNIPEEKIKNM